MPLPTDFVEGDPRPHVDDGHNATNTKVNELETEAADHLTAPDPHGGYQKESEKGAAGGYASLDGSGLVPDAQIPAGVARDSEVSAAVASHEGAANPHAVYLTQAEGDAAYDPIGTAANEVDAHEGAANPHPTYLTEAEADGLYVELDQAEWTDLTDGGSSTLHTHPGGGHPDLATHDALGLATDAELSAHAGAADPHTGYQKESEKGAADGYASLDGSGTVPDAQIPATIARDSELHSQAHSGGDHTNPGTPVTQAFGDAASAGGANNPPAADDHRHGMPANPVTAHESAGDPHGGYRLESVAIVEADIQDDAVTYAKLQNVSTTDRLLGRDTAGAGNVEEIAPAAARTMLDVPATGDVPTLAVFNDHNARHEPGGGDPMAVDAAAGTGSLRSLGTGSTQAAAGNHGHTNTITVGGVILDPTGARFVMIWRAPFACTVTNVRGHRKGGTGATVNARRNQANDFLSSDLSLGTADQWADGGAVQNTAIAAGDDIEIELASITGAVTEIVIQVDLTRP